MTGEIQVEGGGGGLLKEEGHRRGRQQLLWIECGPEKKTWQKKSKLLGSQNNILHKRQGDA